MRIAYALVLMPLFASSLFSQQDAPKAADPRLVVELFAAAPDIVHPVACDFDAKGRLLVIESHTHFAPPGYKGPKADRRHDPGEPESLQVSGFPGGLRANDFSRPSGRPPAVRPSQC